MAPLFDKNGQLHHIKDSGEKLIISSLKKQYKNETQLICLLDLIVTLEKIGLM